MNRKYRKQNENFNCWVQDWRIIFWQSHANIFMSTSIQGQIDTERSGCKQIANGTYIIVPSENHTLSKSEELFFKINEKLNTNLISALRRNQKKYLQ